MWLTLKEAALRLGVDSGTLRTQINRGKLTGEKRGRDWFVLESEVERYANEIAGRKGPKRTSKDG